MNGQSFLGKIVIGVDEVGRGPLAGPVVAAGVVLDENRPISFLADSKKIPEKQRASLAKEIYEKALQVAVCEIDQTVIDRINILQATFLAMANVVNQIEKKLKADFILVDGNKIIPSIDKHRQQAIIKGDSLVPSIMAASIVAKVHRDRLMEKYDADFPQYGFLKHKGYGTKAHLAAINQHGPCPIHRLSFAPLKLLPLL